MKTKMTELKTNANSTVIKTARTIARETKEQATLLWEMSSGWRKRLLEHNASAEILAENYARLQLVIKALETLENDVLDDLSNWSNHTTDDGVDAEAEFAAVKAVYNGLKLIDEYKERAKCLNPIYKLHHKALERGYVRSGETEAKPYNGRFGTGLKLVYSNSDQKGKYADYHNISYYIIA